jgi:hypothetical protein
LGNLIWVEKKIFIENNLISVGIGKGTSIMILKNIPVAYDLRQYNSTIPVPVWYGS